MRTSPNRAGSPRRPGGVHSGAGPPVKLWPSLQTRSRRCSHRRQAPEAAAARHPCRASFTGPQRPGTPSSRPRPTGVFPAGFSTSPALMGPAPQSAPLMLHNSSYLSPCRPLSYLVDKPCSELPLLKHLLWVVSDRHTHGPQGDQEPWL